MLDISTREEAAAAFSRIAVCVHLRRLGTQIADRDGGDVKTPPVLLWGFRNVKALSSCKYDARGIIEPTAARTI